MFSPLISKSFPADAKYVVAHPEDRSMFCSIWFRDNAKWRLIGNVDGLGYATMLPGMIGYGQPVWDEMRGIWLNEANAV